MRFDKHVFISYAHLDNKPLTRDELGWITRFHDTMSSLLSSRLGGTAEIWRDNKLQGNDIFASEIVDQFASTATLVSIVTPRYLKSEWCIREFREFCAQAARSGGVTIGNKARIFKVLKTPINESETMPEVLKDLLGYEFFVYEDGAPLELDPAFGQQFGYDYNRKVGKLAWDVAQLVKSVVEQQENIASDSAQSSAKTVYLAECSHDRRDAREVLEADLKVHGYTVLPGERLPLEGEAQYIESVERLLRRSDLSIHLVGSAYGAVPDGESQKSTTILQNETAARLTDAGRLRRLIWAPPPGTQCKQPMQQAFIDAVHTDAEVQRGADLLTGDIEEFKIAIYSALKKTAPSPEAGLDAAPEVPRIHIVCDERDRKATIALRKFLKERQVELTLPAFEGNAAAVREANQKLVENCNAVVVFYGAGDEAWKRTTDNELRKLRALRTTPLRMYTYLAEPKTNDKQDLLDMQEPGLIDGLIGLPEAALHAIVESLKTGGKSDE